jgi:hypothetical protein
MTTIEHKELKGITVKNLVVTIISTASIVASVMTTYFQLKGDIHDVKTSQETQTRVNDIRLKVLESQVVILQQQVNDIKAERSSTNKIKPYLTTNTIHNLPKITNSINQ